MAEIGESTPGRARAQPALLVRGHDVPLFEGETLIGRAEDCHLCILSGLISRRHAVLTNSSGKVRIDDLGSRNGIFLNGMRLQAPTELQEGDTILLGTTELSFFYARPDGTPSSNRIVLDEQGNVVDAAGQSALTSSSTLVRFEEELEREPREDITVEGRLPPLPRSVSPAGRKAIAPEPSDPPSSKRGQLGASSDSGKLPRLAPIGKISISSSPPVRPTTQPAPKADPLSVVLEVVDKMLARSDLDAAARTLTAQLDRRLALARTGHAISRELVDATSFRLIELCQGTRDPSWLGRTFALFSDLRRPMGNRVLDRLEPLLGPFGPAARPEIARHQALVRELLAEVEVDELAACERILTL